MLLNVSLVLACGVTQADIERVGRPPIEKLIEEAFQRAGGEIVREQP